MTRVDTTYIEALPALIGLLAGGAFGREVTGSISERIKSAQAEGSLSKLVAIGTELKSVRSSTNGLYFPLENELGRALLLLGGTNSEARVVLRKQCEDALQVAAPTNLPEAIEGFRAKSEIAQRLAGEFWATTPSLKDAQLLAGFLAEVRSVLITNYEYAPVSLNVAPPTLGNQLMFAGMDPKTISDPKARADYENALRENQMNNYKNMLQTRALHPADSVISGNLLNYCKSLFAKHPETKNEADNLASMAHLTEAERQQLKQM